MMIIVTIRRLGGNCPAMLSGLRAEAKAFGPRLVLRALCWRFLNRIIPCRALVCMVLEDVDARHLDLPEGFSSRLAGSAELAGHIGAPGFSFTRESLARAERRGDECYAVFDGERLASFGSYSLRPTVIDGYPVYFDAGLVYMHHGFTHPDYRGLRLHAIGMGRALREYQSRGVRMIISDVDVRNLSSLKSVYRLGYRNVGKVYLFYPGGRHFIFASRGARRFGFRFGPPGTGPASENQNVMGQETVAFGHAKAQ